MRGDACGCRCEPGIDAVSGLFTAAGGGRKGTSFIGLSKGASLLGRWDDTWVAVVKFACLSLRHGRGADEDGREVRWL